MRIWGWGNLRVRDELFSHNVIDRVPELFTSYFGTRSSPNSLPDPPASHDTFVGIGRWSLLQVVIENRFQKGKHGGKKGQKIRARPSPPPFRAMPKRNWFFSCEVFPKMPKSLGRLVRVPLSQYWSTTRIVDDGIEMTRCAGEGRKCDLQICRWVSGGL